MNSYKKLYFERLQTWKENLEIILEKESEYNQALTDKYRDELKELKNQLI